MALIGFPPERGQYGIVRPRTNRYKWGNLGFYYGDHKVSNYVEMNSYTYWAVVWPIRTRCRLASTPVWVQSFNDLEWAREATPSEVARLQARLMHGEHWLKP